MGLFSKSSTYDPMSAYTPEQRAAVQALQGLAATGTGGGLTLGQGYSGELGNYTQGQQGLAGGNVLENLMNTAYDKNSDIGKARGVYEGFADLGTFNPDDPRTGYAVFNRALEKAGAESSSAMEREAAITGNRFSTSIGGQKADLAENLNLQRQQQLANTFQASQQFAALGAQGLSGLANQVADIAGLNINYDDYQRQLKDTQAKDAYSEFKRARGEELERIGLMQGQMSNPLGPITTKSPTALAGLTQTALTMAGTAFGGPLGGAIGGALGGAITGGGTDGAITGGVSGLMGGISSAGGMNSLFGAGGSGLAGLWQRPSATADTGKTYTESQLLDIFLKRG